MRDYAKIAPQFWTGETGKLIKEAGRDAQVVALYLLSCPSANMIGLYYLPLPTLTHELGMTTKGALEALRSLSEAGFAHFEGVFEHVFVPEMASHQIGEPLDPKDNRVKGVFREWMSMRKSPFFKDFHTRYQESFHLPIEPPNISPSKAPPKPGAGAGAGAGTEETPLSPLDTIEYPDGFDVPSVRSAISEWLDYKRGRGETYKRPDRQIAKLLGQFSNSVDFVLSVNRSIASNYAGCFPPNGKTTEAPYRFDPVQAMKDAETWRP